MDNDKSFIIPINKYENDAKPNRFQIKPGYMWDGVDRSNDYETRLHSKINDINE